MSEREDDLLQHDFDGIKELDNLLPRWWLYLFYATIAISVLYMAFYHVLRVGYLQDDEYRQEMDPNYQRASTADNRILGVLPEYRSPFYRPGGDRTPRMDLLAGPQKAVVFMTRESDTLTYQAVTDPNLLASGKKTFVTICAQCHGKLGEGGVGPNLTDDYWIHGGRISDVVRTVKYGWPAKGMIAWLGTLKENEILNVASYILTLRGSNPPNARAPQGDLVSY
jgi:cytochrome c oxidase cbb3-type subunit 3